jgi:hypothetical protein
LPNDGDTGQYLFAAFVVHLSSDRVMPFPYPPFLSLAPLDVWWRLLTAPPVRIPITYWPRLLLGLLISLGVTLLTLPERLIFGLRRRKKHDGPAPVFILGYYRSGTTHAQFLLDCDPNLYSPLWYQALCPQGFVVSWLLLRLFLMPFLGSQRPQDNVVFGADVPAEDDFALCNLALASCLPGRHIVPEARDFYDRFNDLTRLTPEELERFRAALLGFLARIQMPAGRRRILLKSPSHTARVAELLQLFSGGDGPPPVFIHISRKPEAVVRSNVSMQKDINEMYHLQDPRTDDDIEERSVAEYLATEEKFLAEKALIPPGQLAEVRLEDLQADPLGELQRIYRELNLPYTPEFERRVLAYLEATRDFKPNRHAAPPPEKARALAERLAPLTHTFGHDRPAIPAREVPPAAREVLVRQRFLAGLSWLVGLGVGVLVLLMWLGLVSLFHARIDRMVLVVGLAIGASVSATSPQGSWQRGLWCLLLAVGFFLAGALLTTLRLHPSSEPLSWADAWSTTWDEIVYWRLWLWEVLGLVLAYRLPSRRWR